MLRKSLVSLLAASTLMMAADKLNGAGATFPAPLYYDWAYTYEKTTGTKVNYQSIGSGGGIKQVKSRIVDFGASDEPLQSDVLKKDKLMQFPAAIGSIVVVYNIPGIKDNEIKLKNEIVGDIFLGKITKWNDPKIKADNPNVNLPDKEITVVHRSDGSGTTFNFTYYLSEVNKEWKEKVGTGKAVDWPVGLGGKGNEGVTNYVKQTPFSIGYVEQAYKRQNNLSGATVTTASGKWVEATEDNAKASAKYAKWSKDGDFYQILALQPGDNSYPIVAGTFILLPEEKADMNKDVVKFFDNSFKNGDKSAIELGYIPLPEETKNLIRSYWKDKGIY
ncbi:MAG: phosphate ABC transporter substrate-binding protein PstS [Campylobacterales bacterium]|nr:phosphate ABC transporter substrate-binding protein PstS [Campylobacterales bacterium]